MDGIEHGGHIQGAGRARGAKQGHLPVFFARQDRRLNRPSRACHVHRRVQAAKARLDLRQLFFWRAIHDVGDAHLLGLGAALHHRVDRDHFRAKLLEHQRCQQPDHPHAKDADPIPQTHFDAVDAAERHQSQGDQGSFLRANALGQFEDHRSLGAPATRETAD